MELICRDTGCAEEQRIAEDGGCNKILVRVKSETESMDDGYTWKKYGQKPIKNKSYPRSYFKCKEEGCVVKKQTERCCDDAEFVLVTYQGMHNHPPKSDLNSASTLCYDLRLQLFQPAGYNQGG